MRRLLAFAATAVVVMQLFAKSGQPERTQVEIESNPSGALVSVDGQEWGRSPLTIRTLEPGRHLLKYSMIGYNDSYCYITVEANRPMRHSEDLVPEKGLLLVKSDPEGCDITIDGASFGVTPRLITDLNAKDPHKMILSKTGYGKESFNIKFDGREPLVFDETLSVDSGFLHVDTVPNGATVMLNGIERGRTPIDIAEVPKGRAWVRLVLPGFEDEVISDIVVSVGATQTVSRVMKGLPGTLNLSSVPGGARFYLNGEFKGKGTTVISSLAAGDYVVKAELEGFGELTRTVSVRNGESVSEEFRLLNVMGRLEVRTDPPGAQLYFDGRFIGTTSTNDPDAQFSDVFSIENIIEGDHHKLKVKKHGYREVNRYPKIRSQKTTTAKVRLRRVFTPNIEITTDTRVFKCMLISETPDMLTVESKLGVQSSIPRADIRKTRVLNDEKDE